MFGINVKNQDKEKSNEYWLVCCPKCIVSFRVEDIDSFFEKEHFKCKSCKQSTSITDEYWHFHVMIERESYMPVPTSVMKIWHCLSCNNNFHKSVFQKDTLVPENFFPGKCPLCGFQNPPPDDINFDEHSKQTGHFVVDVHIPEWAKNPEG